MTKNEVIEIVIKAVSALGTLVLAFLAIFGPTVKKWFYKSNLDFEIKSKDPFVIKCNTTEIFSSETSESVAINLKIKNTGNVSAVNTQLYTEKIFRVRQENQTYFLDREIIPANFIWNNEAEIKSLTPLMSHFVEIAKIQPQTEYTTEESTNKEVSRSRDLLFLSVPDPSLSGEFIKLGKGTFLVAFPVFQTV